MGLISMAVEAKAGEPFDKTIDEWLADAKPTSGKPARLKQLREVLEIQGQLPGSLRYQLLHRAASAVLEAERFGAQDAVLLVQSFAADPDSLSAFSQFGAILGCDCSTGMVVGGPTLGGVKLHLAWLDCEPSDAALLAAAV
jgi:hypothetical protein